MTSMLLTPSRAGDAGIWRRKGPGFSPRPLPENASTFLAAIPRGNAFFLRVLRCGFLDHRPHDRLVGVDPVGDGVPLVTVPLQELHCAPALVVHARHLERLHESCGAE